MADVSSKVIEKLKKRDEKAFDIVYDQYYRLVYYVAYDILNDAEGAEDVLQDTFLRLMDNIESYEDKGSFRQYLTSIARNLAFNEYKRRKTADLAALPDDASSNDDHSSFSAVLMIENTLDKEESQIVKYKVLMGYSFQEIASEMHITLGIAQSHYYQAMKKLREHFEKEER